jgi:hypothetical protein
MRRASSSCVQPRASRAARIRSPTASGVSRMRSESATAAARFCQRRSALVCHSATCHTARPAAAQRGRLRLSRWAWSVHWG